MTYQDEIRKLGDETGEQVAVVVDDFLAEKITFDEAVAVIAALVAKANGRAVALADLSLAATLMLQAGEPVPTLGLVPPEGDADRLATAAATLLAVPTLTRERGARLGRSEPLQMAARAYSEGIEKSDLVDAWTRKVSPGACEICQSLAGATLPASTPMFHHKGCTCVPVPIKKEK